MENNYAFEDLGECAVEAQAGVEYRLSLRCQGGMRDCWYDDSPEPEELELAAQRPSARCVRFLGGACRNGDGYPNREDGTLRRAGMVNFRLVRRCLDFRVVSKRGMARRVALAAAADAVDDPQLLDTCVSIAATILALLVDELPTSGVPALVLLVPEELLCSGRPVRPETAEAEAEFVQGLLGMDGGITCPE
mmetsp:Transcript_85400/g.236664  ORF Transcript_85400/g.236664 Transcript_85400/m.236664 type:complete len:192 (+) Transcript_85400:251-826(+)